jgi:Domain of unknown function (DUF4159)
MKDDLWKEFPTKRIEPVDGLAVTAAIWKEAHDYHRAQFQFHNLLSHGPGIVAGLNVVASDPPDSTVYIMPGMAIDPNGETIIVTEPVAYDVGTASGFLYLLISYDQSQPRASGGPEEPHFVHAEFGIEVRPGLPDAPCMELARFKRESRESPLLNAQDPEHPGPNEIDLRFRRSQNTTLAEVVPRAAVSVAVCYASGHETDVRHGRGVTYLTRALRSSHPGGVDAWVDLGVPLAADLEKYALVYLVGDGTFQLGRDEMNALYTYLQGGGTLFFESCRQGSGHDSLPADTSFSDLLASFGISCQELQTGDSLLVEPYLFGAPPPGWETEGTPKVLLGTAGTGQVIWSMCDYGCLWQGERRGRAASRDEIRTAVEWGTNLIIYALKQHQDRAGSQAG